jgi:hypothetical protein
LVLQSPSADNRWPDAWCATCHADYERHGQWNNENEAILKIKLLCHRCYEAQRRQGDHVVVPDFELPD